nr:MAG TPA: hypothetical protein [Caudoviricetes sp.]
MVVSNAEADGTPIYMRLCPLVMVRKVLAVFLMLLP